MIDRLWIQNAITTVGPKTTNFLVQVLAQVHFFKKCEKKETKK